MSVFISKRLKTLCNEVTNFDWNHSASLLAVTSISHASNGDAFVIDAMSQSVIMSVSRPCTPSKIAWHPLSNLLAVGWSSGTLSFLHVASKNCIDTEKLSSFEVTCVLWSNNGTCLLATDAAGFAYLWLHTSLSDTQPFPYATITLGSSCICAILLTLSRPIQNDLSLNTTDTSEFIGTGEQITINLNSTDTLLGSPSKAESPCFILGCKDGRVLRISGETSQSGTICQSSSSRLSTLFTCEGSILLISCQCESGNLAAITDKGILYHFHIASTNGTESNELAKVKLAVGTVNNPSLVWAGKSLLAMATGEPFVRLWDVEHADNYTLIPNIDMDKSVKVTHVVYSSKHRLTPKCATYILTRQPLCGNLGGGGCVVVQTGPRSLSMFTPERSYTDASKIAPTCVSKGLETNPMATPQANSVHAPHSASSTVFLSGDLLKGSHSSTSLQDDSNSVQSVREHEAQVNDQILALYCTQDYVSYWNGHRISTFSHVNGGCIAHHASFPCDFRLVGMFDQSLFTVEQFKLHVRSLQGTVKQLVNFTENDGSVLLTDRCANHLACFTDQGKIRVFDLDRR
ncbi:unnamed protein product [Dicrocoelium dendriticum]|nr:unnamed protein product [Dicrocoelium dendriticum]